MIKMARKYDKDVNDVRVVCRRLANDGRHGFIRHQQALWNPVPINDGIVLLPLEKLNKWNKWSAYKWITWSIILRC